MLICQTRGINFILINVKGYIYILCVCMYVCALFFSPSIPPPLHSLYCSVAQTEFLSLVSSYSPVDTPLSQAEGQNTSLS